MRNLSVCLVLVFLAASSHGRVVRRDSELINKDTQETKVQVVLQVADPADDDIEVTTDEDTQIILPSRGARVLSFTPANQVAEYVKSLIPTGEKIRPVTRTIMGAVQGHQHCWQKMICQTGRMLSGFKQAPDFLDMVDKYGPNAVKEVVEIMRSSAVQGDDCSALICDA
ncbi:uncharacterized protein LOC132193074 [Neocloeon triangulifer]|uniref:uncharacterized protein LOC132193074 n=1 Tax=Neocloeon triangulifer TaxID=2078957 RepID=UPI00286F08FF|nr:uncharacterized protein LOC132193074 [Neocloeon triangulifer]